MKLQDILKDRTHGSTFLAKSYLRLITREEPSKKKIKSWNNQLLDQFSDMEIFHNVIEKLNRVNDPKCQAENILMELNKTERCIAKKLEHRINTTSSIMTFSNSHTIQKVIEKITLGKVYCIASYPGGEGKELAQKVGGKVVEDGNLKEYLFQIDFILLGCDSYNSDHIVNKVGTQDLVSLAKEMEIPVFCLTSKYKQTGNKMQIDNELFEVISREYLTMIIC